MYNIYLTNIALKTFNVQIISIMLNNLVVKCETEDLQLLFHKCIYFFLEFCYEWFTKFKVMDLVVREIH